MSDQATVKETIQAQGDQVLETVKRLIHEGNVRRITIRKDDRTIVEVPLTLGAVGVLAAPWLAAVAAIVAVVNDCTIVVEREASPAEPGAETSPEEPEA